VLSGAWRFGRVVAMLDRRKLEWRQRCLLALLICCLQCRPIAFCGDFLPVRQGKVTRAAFNLGGFFGGGKEEEDFKAEVPKDVAALVAGMKGSTENALQSRCSRLDVELPPSFQLGVENKDRAKARVTGDEQKKVVLKEVARGDRELARVFVEMLGVVKGLVVAFRTPQLEKAAKKRWRLTPEEATVISFPGTVKSAFATEVSGPTKFLQKLEDLDCKCLLVVAPELEQLRTVADLSKKMEDQMGIILLNARIHGNKSRKARKLPPRLRDYLQKEFEPSYHVRFLEKKEWPDNSIIFRQICPDGEGPWIVAVQRELIGGAVVTNEVLRTNREPTAEEITEAFERYEASDKDPTDTIAEMLRKDRE